MLCSVTSRFIIAATLQPGCSAASHAPSLVRALQQLENRVCLVGLQQQTHQDRSSLSMMRRLIAQQVCMC